MAKRKVTTHSATIDGSRGVFDNEETQLGEPETNGHHEAETGEPLPVAEPSMSALEQAHYSEIKEMEKRVRELEDVASDKKLDAKIAKDAFESADTALRNLIRRGPYQAELPFGKEEEANEDWKAVSVEELGISASMIAGLDEAGFKTIGDLAAHTEAGKELTDINGIGPKKAEDLAARLATWWDEHPDYVTGDDLAEADENAELAGVE